MDNSIIPPILKIGQCSVMQADVNTGHLLQINGKLYLGKGEIFKIFIEFDEAEKYVTNQILSNENLEFVIYDFNGKKIMYISKYVRKNIE